MNRRNTIKTILLGSFYPSFNTLFAKNKTDELSFKSNWHEWQDMKWIGPEYWGNRLQDWEIINGKAVCNITGANRTLHLLQIQNSNSNSSFSAKVKIDILNRNTEKSAKSFIGIKLGAKGRFDDYRSASVFGKGYDIGLNSYGNLLIGNHIIETNLNEPPESFELLINADYSKENYTLTIEIKDLNKGENVFKSQKINVLAEILKGNFALVSHFAKKGSDEVHSAAFSDWEITSGSLSFNENRIFGPICFAQYTLNKGKLKLTAQLTPIENIHGHTIRIEFKKDNDWEIDNFHCIDTNGRAVNFEIYDWHFKKDIPYRVVVSIPLKNSTNEYVYEGTIAQEPHHLNEVKAAVFSCNADHGFPDSDINKNMNALSPDIVLFLGDQFYEGTGGFGPEFRNTLDKKCLDYLRKWYMFGWSYREIFRHKPCAIIPDDHDVYHGNVWGESGKAADMSEGVYATAQDSGGYKMPAEWVNMVQFTQTSHLPDAFDPTPVKQNIGVYYTHWNYAGISFAILEDRKFKSAPKNVLPPEADIWNGWIRNPNFDIKKHRDINASLLGERQHDFLRSFTKDWDNNAQMKVILSQTNFATVATLPKSETTDANVPKMAIPKKGDFVLGDRPTADMDSNGWPQKQRDKAVELIRKSFSFHIAGDQHLGSFIQYGLEEHKDSGFAFAGPALNNIWPRRFWPEVDYKNHSLKSPAYVGNHIDGFGNKMTVKAINNPFQTNLEPEIIHNRATGYGLVTFNKKDRTIKTECWSRFHNPIKDRKVQNPGWPITINQADNYGRKEVGFLPNLVVSGANSPVIELYNSAGDLVYCIRINGNQFKAKVFDLKPHSLVIINTENGISKILDNLSIESDYNKQLNIDLG